VIGSGHVMRCLALAQVWRSAAGEVIFAMAESTPAIERRVTEERCRVVRIAGAPGSGKDRSAMRALVAAELPSWIVLDSYAFDSNYRQMIQDTGRRCLIVDDAGSNEHFACDLLLNQNLYASETMYPERAPHTQLLLGPRYAMLRDEFAQYRDWSRNIPQKAKRVLVTMGGSDPSNVTPRILRSLVALEDLQIRAVIGGSADDASAVEEAAGQYPERVKVFRDVRNMAELMAWADLAIAGAGTTCWEMCLLALPAVLIVVAENQEPIARGLASAGAALEAGRAQEIDCSTLTQQVEAILADAARRRAMSRAARELVDGCGKERVLQAMGVGESLCA
jgi:UDP-2,4-diacetamido-2,4,6-trideoxy-beta-L-altropyranose hydrolase